MRSTLTRILAVCGILFAMLGGVSAPASAHDQILSSDPRDGQNITPEHREFVLTFTDKIQTFGAEIVYEDPAGKRTTLTPNINRDQLRAEYPANLPVGSGNLRWRAVSSDGHPVDGIITFTVVDPSKGTPTPQPTAKATSSAPASTTSEPGPSVNWPLLFLGTFAVICGVVGSIIGYRLRKKEH